jgi:hypothetical protein
MGTGSPDGVDAEFGIGAPRARGETAGGACRDDGRQSAWRHALGHRVSADT